MPLFFWFDLSLEGRAEIPEMFRWSYGRNDYFIRTFWKYLTFSALVKALYLICCAYQWGQLLWIPRDSYHKCKLFLKPLWRVEFHWVMIRQTAVFAIDFAPTLQIQNKIIFKTNLFPKAPKAHWIKTEYLRWNTIHKCDFSCPW